MVTVAQSVTKFHELRDIKAYDSKHKIQNVDPNPVPQEFSRYPLTLFQYDPF